MGKDPVVDAPTRRQESLVNLTALDAFEVAPGRAGEIHCAEVLGLEPGTVAIVFPEVLQLAGPQAARVVTGSGQVQVSVFNMNPTRRLTGAAGERVGSLVVVRLA